jgi:hypothetical protein
MEIKSLIGDACHAIVRLRTRIVLSFEDISILFEMNDMVKDWEMVFSRMKNRVNTC